MLLNPCTAVHGKPHERLPDSLIADISARIIRQSLTEDKIEEHNLRH